MVGNQKVVKAFGYEEEAQQKFEEINGRLQDSGGEIAVCFLADKSKHALCERDRICGGGHRRRAFRNQRRDHGRAAFELLIYANQYTKPFNEISGVVTELQTAFASARRVFEVLDEPSETPDAPGAAVMRDSKGMWRLRTCRSPMCLTES